MTRQKNAETRPGAIGASSPASRQVSWFEVYRYAERLATSHGVGLDHLPLPGTPQWCGMPDDSAEKLLALVLGGVREALAHEIHQDAMAEASQAISAAVDWTALSKRITQGRGPAYIPRKAS